MSEDEVFVVKFVEFVFSNGKLAHVLCLVHVFFGADFEDSLTADLAATGDKEAYWFEVLNEALTVLFGLAKVSRAVEILDGFFPGC